MVDGGGIRRVDRRGYSSGDNSASPKMESQIPGQ
jgi:hypothetical protein